jgi:hypothetical protein
MRCLLVALASLLISTAAACGAVPFGIQVVDDESGRGVPMVELETVNRVRYVTDSAGLAAIDDPALVDRKVFFTVTSLGYEFPTDGFGSRGRSVLVKPGTIETLKIKRLNIAERLYRVTGEGIYRDTVMLGRKPPIAQPLLNAQVVGQDSVQAAIYRDRLYFFWGDTSRQSYPLGLFRTAGATADLPGKGGLDPSLGVDLRYFANDDGFARAMVPGTEPGVVWIDGVFTLKDESGNERMLAHAERLKGLGHRLGRSLIVFDDASQAFHKLKDIDLKAPLAPAGYPFRVTDGGVDYVYFPTPYPSIRVRATWTDATDLSAYEAYTCIKPGMSYADTGDKFIERGPDGKAVFAWARGAAPLKPKQLHALLSSGRLKPEDCPFRLQDAGGKRVLLHGSSVRWNAYRRRWVMIGVEEFGASTLGEVWYAESERPEGPWVRATKVATHHRERQGNVPGASFDFYNPVHHAFYDQDGGRVIYFEGTHTNTFSGDPRPTPRYEYNQLMYRLDLSDERLTK